MIASSSLTSKRIKRDEVTHDGDVPPTVQTILSSSLTDREKSNLICRDKTQLLGILRRINANPKNTILNIYKIYSHKVIIYGSSCIHQTTLRKALLKNRRIEEITLYGQKLRYATMMKLIKSLPNFKGVKELRIDFLKCSLDDRIFRLLCKNTLYYCHQLKNLDIFVEKCAVTDKSLVYLSKILNHARNLESFKFRMKQATLTEEGFQSLMSSLPRMPFLNYLLLSFGDMMQINSSIINYFAENIALKLKRVTTLWFFVEGMQIGSPQTISNLLKQLNKLVYLDKLVFCFERSSFSTNEGMSDVFSQLEHFHPLTTLSLNFEQCEYFGEEILHQIAKALKKQPTLKCLNLYSSRCLSIGTASLNYFFKALENLEDPREMDFFFTSDTQLKSLSLDVFASAALKQNWENFSSLTFNARETCLADQEIGSFVNSWSVFKNMKELTLDFGHCNEITNYSLKQISKNICYLVTLKTFRISFGSCTKLDDQHIAQFVESLQVLKELETLDLSLVGILGVKNGDIILTSAKKSLVSLKKLKNFLLSVSKLEGITSYGLTKFAEGLENLDQLELLELYLAETGITDEGITALLEIIPNFSQIVSVKLFLQRVKKLGTPTLQKLSTCFKSLKTLGHISLSLNGNEIEFTHAIEMIEAFKNSLKERINCLVSIRDSKSMDYINRVVFSTRLEALSLPDNISIKF